MNSVSLPVTIVCRNHTWVAPSYLISVGWSYEGIGWYSDDGKSVPLYRDYNPNAFANNHNYTTNAEEHSWLVSLG